MPGRWSAEGRPAGTQPVPAHLNYDVWLGPAEPWPYHPTYLPANWRSYWNFGNGTLGDMACHHMDLPFWALNLKYPTKVTPVDGPAPHKDGACVADRAVGLPRRRGGRRARGPVSLTWHGTQEDERPAELDEWGLPAKWQAGNVFVGEKGRCSPTTAASGCCPTRTTAACCPTWPSRAGWRPTPGRSSRRSRASRAVGRPPPRVGRRLPQGRPGGHALQLRLLRPAHRVRAARLRRLPRADADRMGRAEPEGDQHPRAADQYLRRPYRKGWELTV